MVTDQPVEDLNLDGAVVVRDCQLALLIPPTRGGLGINTEKDSSGGGGGSSSSSSRKGVMGSLIEGEEEVVGVGEVIGPACPIESLKGLTGEYWDGHHMAI